MTMTDQVDRALLEIRRRGILSDTASIVDAVWGRIVERAELEGTEPPKAWRYATAGTAGLTLEMEGA
jgi:hypothetical protein